MVFGSLRTESKNQSTSWNNTCSFEDINVQTRSDQSRKNRGKKSISFWEYSIIYEEEPQLLPAESFKLFYISCIFRFTLWLFFFFSFPNTPSFHQSITLVFFISFLKWKSVCIHTDFNQNSSTTEPSVWKDQSSSDPNQSSCELLDLPNHSDQQLWIRPGTSKSKWMKTFTLVFLEKPVTEERNTWPLLCPTTRPAGWRWTSELIQTHRQSL